MGSGCYATERYIGIYELHVIGYLKGKRDVNKHIDHAKSKSN